MLSPTRNELNQSAIVEEEKPQEATPTQLPIYKALTTEIPEGFVFPC